MGKLFISAIAIALLSATVHANESVGTLDLDAKRNEALKAFEDRQISNPDKILMSSEEIFAKPIEKQNIEELNAIAKEANYYSNLVNFILDKYDDFKRDNYRYKFVTEKVSPIRDKYVIRSNKFKKIRNMAYLNIGMKYRASGNNLKAFLFFKDAYRLTSFDCGKEKPKENCLRWRAEQEMKDLLSIKNIESFVSWQGQ